MYYHVTMNNIQLVACPTNPALARGNYYTREDSYKARESGWQAPQARGGERPWITDLSEASCISLWTAH